MKGKINFAVSKLIERLKLVLCDNLLSVYIYGSCVLGDFKFGWSDIDILVLTKKEIKEDVANKIMTLRQDLSKEYQNNNYFRSFEGAILSLDGFINQTKENIVYWGTKGERLRCDYTLDSFSMKELIEDGELVYGEDIRKELVLPTFEDLKRDIKRHYDTIREHVQTTGRNLYSFGWFLDISRCIYTLFTGKIISKTRAGYWALRNKFCPDVKALKTSLKVRKNPIKYKKMIKIMNYAETLGPSVQKYADVLENYLKNKRT